MTKKKNALCVEVQGKRRYINVSVGRALELHNYLRSNRVRCGPPEPSFTGFDSIELAADGDMNSVEALLKNWK